MLLHRVLIFSALCWCVSYQSAAKIVFQSTRLDGNYDIYVMDDDGSNTQRLMDSPLKDAVPRWSPDGKQIIFSREKRREDKPGQQQIDVFLMNSDGSFPQQLTHHIGISSSPVWSADGERIAFGSNHSGFWNIHVIDIGNRESQQLTHNEDRRHTISVHDWSPSGKNIAYSATTPPAWRTIYIMDTNGENPRPLVKGAGTLRYSARWSPDGQKILYCDAEYQGNLLLLNKIVVRDENGALLRELKTPASWLIHSACWMGANHILIASEKWQSPQPQSDIYRYSLGPDEITQLTNHPSRDQSPDWISDTTLSVSPLKKKKISWGTLKTQEKK